MDDHRGRRNWSMDDHRGRRQLLSMLLLSDTEKNCGDLIFFIPYGPTPKNPSGPNLRKQLPHLLARGIWIKSFFHY